MAISRRNALTMLGLGATGAIAAEDISKSVPDGSNKPTGYHFGADPKLVAGALRALAAEIEVGGSHAQEMTFVSKVSNEDFLIHTLSIQFAMKVDDATS